MKKNLIITFTFALLLLSCKKADITPDTQAGTTVGSTGPVTITPPPPNMACENYSISNTQRPSGITLTYEYDDCGGTHRNGTLAPLQEVYITARPGSVICVGGFVVHL